MAQIAIMAAIHQYVGSENRLHRSARQAIQKPLAPASSTQTRACGANPPSIRPKAASRSPGGESRRIAGMTTIVTKATPPIHSRIDRM